MGYVFIEYNNCRCLLLRLLVCTVVRSPPIYYAHFAVIVQRSTSCQQIAQPVDISRSVRVTFVVCYHLSISLSYIRQESNKPTTVIRTKHCHAFYFELAAHTLIIIVIIIIILCLWSVINRCLGKPRRGNV